jgi:hypothetical protein
MISPWLSVRVPIGWGLAVAVCGIEVSDGRIVAEAGGGEVDVSEGKGGVGVTNVAVKVGEAENDSPPRPGDFVSQLIP